MIKNKLFYNETEMTATAGYSKSEYNIPISLSLGKKKNENDANSICSRVTINV